MFCIRLVVRQQIGPRLLERAARFVFTSQSIPVIVTVRRFNLVLDSP